MVDTLLCIQIEYSDHAKMWYLQYYLHIWTNTLNRCNCIVLHIYRNIKITIFPDKHDKILQNPELYSIDEL